MWVTVPDYNVTSCLELITSILDARKMAVTPSNCRCSFRTFFLFRYLSTILTARYSVSWNSSKVSWTWKLECACNCLVRASTINFPPNLKVALFLSIECKLQNRVAQRAHAGNMWLSLQYATILHKANCFSIMTRAEFWTLRKTTVPPVFGYWKTFSVILFFQTSTSQSMRMARMVSVISAWFDR